MSAPEVVRVFFLMVHHPAGIIRAGHAYREKATAQSWRRFVSKAWRGLRVTVEPCDLRFVDGRLDEASVRLLDERYNMDPPASPDALAPALSTLAPGSRS